MSLFSEVFAVSGVCYGGCLYVFARSCSLLSKYLPISWKQRKEQSHAQYHVTQRIRIFDKISEHVKLTKSNVPEGPVTLFVAFCQRKPFSQSIG